MEALDLARWQFGITTVYHFIFVPLTIGLSPLVAIMQTIWYKTGKEEWLRLTRFFGKLMLINFAIGVVTGIVQEFQFGMNWSEYSRFVGDIFGAPLAMEGLVAFFLESTFLGLWIFGWNRLPKKVHLASIWCVAIGTNISAIFILAANSWMQHPVGAIFNPETGRAEMDDFMAVLTNNTLWAAFTHTASTAFLVAGTFVAGIAGWHLVRSTRRGEIDLARKVWRPAALLGLITVLVSGIGVIASGDWQSKVMFEQQPMKMAAAEGICETANGVGFSILTVGDLNNNCDGVRHLIEIPGMTSFLATGDFDSELQGIGDLQDYYADRYGELDDNGEPIDYSPNLVITYWSFRLMIGFGFFSAVLAVVGLFLLRKSGSVTDNIWFSRLSLLALPMPFIAASFGWIFTEMGRQPWVVAPNLNGVDQVRMLTQNGVSTVVSWGSVLTSLVVFTLLYGVLAVVWFLLLKNYTIEGVSDEPATDPWEEPQDPGPEGSDDSDDDESSRPLSFAY